MNWWRAHHGLPYDSKLAVVAKRCGVRRCEVLAVWIACLDFASQHEDRGAVQGIDAEEVGCSLDLDPSTVTSILDAFRVRDMISVTPCNASETQGRERVTAWDRRQVQRERDDDSTERVRRYRQKLTVKDLPVETPLQHHVTPRNAPEQNRTEKSREEQNIDFAPRQLLQNRVVELPGPSTQESDDQFELTWKRWPRQTGKAEAARDWVSVVGPKNVQAVVACVDEYLGSEEVSRGICQNLGSTERGVGWLIKCAKDKWQCKWPKARDAQSAKLSIAEQAKLEHRRRMGEK